MRITQLISRKTKISPKKAYKVSYLDGGYLRSTVFTNLQDTQDLLDAWWDFCHEAGLKEDCASSITAGALL